MVKVPKAVKRVWEVVSHGHTAYELLMLALKPILGTGLGVGGGLVAWLNSFSPLVIFFSVAGGVGLGLFISNEMEGRRLQRRRLAAALYFELVGCDFYWCDSSGGTYKGFRPDIENLTLVMDAIVAITAFPRLLVESIEMKLRGKTLPSNWESQEIIGSSFGEYPIAFHIPDWVNPGAHSVYLIAEAGGQKWQSTVQTISIPRRLSSDK